MSTKLLSVFSRDIFNLLENLEEFNVTIHVGEQDNSRTFHAHSLILKARSSYFNTALSKQWAKQKDEKNILNQPNISPEIFEIILSYIYSGKISLQERTITEILEILSAGDELLLNDLLDYIQDYLVDTKADWLPNYILEIYRKTLDHQSCEKLREFILATISADPELLFNSKDFLKIEESLLLPILKRDDLDMAEDEVWDQIVNWGIAQDLDLHPAIKEWDYDDFNKLKTILDKCIPLIRFFQMSSSDLYDKVWSPFRLILPPNLEDDIVRCHLKQGSKPIYGINTPRGNSTLIGHKEMLRIAYWIDKNDTPISNNSHININGNSNSNSSSINISSSLLSSTPISSTSTNNNNINTNNSSSSASNIPATTNEMPYKFKLLVRGTRDGFDSKTFHQKCDNQGPTFVIMRISSTNEVIGGYNPIKWQTGSGHLETRDSFLFTFGNRDRIEDAKVSRVSRFNYAITLKDDSYGPCFGDKDLWMYGNFDKPESCSSKEDDYETWITKSRKFGVSEYEVFKIIKK